MSDLFLSRPWIYRAWQAPFVRQKLRPFQDRHTPDDTKRVIDVGCGPGTNARLFSPGNYVGVDLSEKYVIDARRRLGHRFEVWDITQPGPNLGTFDMALVNSVLHHLSDDETKTVFRALPWYLNQGATVHIVDLVLPEDRSLARTLARLDRGDFPRSLDHWRELFGGLMTIHHFQPFRVGLMGTRMWDMVYVEGSLANSGKPDA
jgi:SAM-dependent methyltransferase